MPALPGSLALTPIADGSNIVAADHRNNYTAIQTAINALIADLGGGTAGQVLRALSSSSFDWETPPGAVISHTQITANATSVATTEATATTAITAPAFTPDGTSAYLFEFFCPQLGDGNIQANIAVSLHDGTAFVGQLLQAANGGTTVASSALLPGAGRYRYVPTATSKTYTARLWCSGGTATIYAGAAGAGAFVPAFLRITKDS